jgi:hypothetical protein
MPTGEIDVDVIENALQAQLQAYLGASVTVLVEEEAFGQQGDCVIIYLDRFDVPAEKQTLAAGRRQDEELRITVWAFHHGMEIAGCRQARNKLHRRVKQGILRDRTLGGTVETLWVVGGEYQTLPETEGFTLGASIELLIEVRLFVEVAS